MADMGPQGGTPDITIARGVISIVPDLTAWEEAKRKIERDIEELTAKAAGILTTVRSAQTNEAGRPAAFSPQEIDQAVRGGLDDDKIDRIVEAVESIAQDTPQILATLQDQSEL